MVASTLVSATAAVLTIIGVVVALGWSSWWSWAAALVLVVLAVGHMANEWLRRAYVNFLTTTMRSLNLFH